MKEMRSPLATRAFEPEFLRKLDGLMIATRRARTHRAGQRTIGRHQGGGIEPENFREYAHGDDLRFLDWNALARHDDLSIRTFRAERQLEITIMVDASASMAIPADDDKLGLALTLGAGLAFIVAIQSCSRHIDHARSDGELNSCFTADDQQSPSNYQQLVWSKAPVSA